MDDGALKERAERFIRDNTVLSMTDDDGDPLPDSVSDLVALMREVATEAAREERHWLGEEVCEPCQEQLARNDDYLRRLPPA